MKEAQQNSTNENRIRSLSEERIGRLRKNYGIFTGIGGLVRALKFEGESPESFLKDIESSSFADEILTPMLTVPRVYRYPLALGLAHHTTHTLPDSFKEELAIRDSPGNSLSVERYYPGIDSLCPSSEPNLRYAAKEDALIVINDALLVKYVGIKSALCVQSFTTEQGAFVEGNWYIPSDKPTHEKVKELYFQGQGRPTITDGTWTLSREHDRIDSFFLPFAQHIAREIPEQLSGTEISRRKIEEYYKGAHIRP